MRAEKVGRDTMLAQIVQMVAQAQRSRAPIQRLADRVSGWFVPAVIAVALLAFGAWAWFGPEPRYAYGLVAAVSVLIIACPCALGLATPMSIMVGVGRGARAGILIKNAEALERMERVDTLVIDKTGTLTEGKPKVVAVIPTHGLDENEDPAHRRRRRAAAASIRWRARSSRRRPSAASTLPDVRGFNSPTGKGVVGMIERHRVALGSAKFLAELGIAAAELEPQAERLRQDGATAVFLAVDGKPSGVIAVADPVRATAPAALKALKRAGIRIVMLTGDNRTTAQAVAKQLGIDEVEADLLPEQKAQIGRAAAPRGPRRRDGGRRRQRRAGAGRGRRRHRDGDGHRRRDRERRHHAAQGRSHRHHQGAAAVAGRDAQHPAEPGVRLHLQRGRRADRRRRALSGVRHPAVADDRRGGDGAVVGQRGRQRAAAVAHAAL